MLCDVLRRPRISVPELLRPRPLVFPRQLICNCGFYVSSLLFGTERELEYCTGLKVPPKNREGSRHRPNFEVCFYVPQKHPKPSLGYLAQSWPPRYCHPVTALDRSWRSSKWPRPFRRDSSTGNTETTCITRIKLTPPKSTINPRPDGVNVGGWFCLEDWFYSQSRGRQARLNCQ